MRPHRSAWLLALGVATTILPRPALADPPTLDIDAVCTASYTGAQRSRLHAQLRLARKQLLACLHPSCSQVLRKDCAAWLEEVDELTPTIAIAAHDPAGHLVTNVHVSIDGEPLAPSISDAPIGVDPGVHTLRFEAPGSNPIERSLVIHEKDKALPVDIRFTATEPRAVVDGARAEPRRSIPVSAYVLGISGAVVLAGGAAFEGIGLSQRAHLDTCRGHCTPQQVNEARETVAAGDIALAVGAAAVAAAAYVAFLRPRPVAGGALRVQLVPLAAGLAMQSTF